MIKILANSDQGKLGTAEFSIEAQGHEMKGKLSFRIRGQKLDVVDPFGGQNRYAYEVVSSLLQFELRQKGLLS